MKRLWPLLLCLTGCDCQPAKPTDDAGFDAGVDAGTDAGAQGELFFTIEDFGAVLRGDSVARVGTFTNTRATSIAVTSLTVNGAGFSLLAGPSLTVPAHGESTVQVQFAPLSLGEKTGELTYDGTSVALHGTGIGPSLALRNSSIALGAVPLYDGAPATASTTLTASNDGHDAVPHRPDTALQLFFDVQSTSTALASELCVGDCTGTAFNIDVGEAHDVPVVLSSTTPGMKTWDVRVFSNDPETPMVTVPVTAEVIARPTCQFAVPASLAFGVLTSPESRELEVILENVGTEVCEVTRVELGPDPLFSLVNAPLGLQSIAPGELLRVSVRASPQGVAPTTPVAVSSELRFALNHPTGFARVPLTAQLELSCLTVAPTPVDFGTVQTGCRSADRAVLLRNICSRALVVTSATLPGFSSFSLTATLPVTLNPSGAVSLSARYTPFAPGPARDVIDVAWLDGAIMKHTTVPLRGDANATGQNVDDFPAQTNKLDLLLVLDDSCSMTPFSPQLNTQLPQILAALQLRNVDFHVGVLDAVMGPPDGTLRRTSTGQRWLTPLTPSLSARFTELTAWTGTQMFAESCEEPVMKALTAPNVNDPLINGGFLRPDATLSVLCISDRTDTNFRLAELIQAVTPRRFIWNDLGPVAPSTPQCAVEHFQRSGVSTHAATGGQLFDICASNWSPLFADVIRATDQREFFPLRARPDLLGTPPLSVSVRGAPLPQVTDGGVPFWTWESAPNAVLFNPIYAPATFDPVSISYPVACMP